MGVLLINMPDQYATMLDETCLGVTDAVAVRVQPDLQQTLFSSILGV